jgi:hypothetical protein
MTIYLDHRVAIYVLGRDFKVLHGFTNDSSQLVRALAKYKGRHPTEDTDLGPNSVSSTGNRRNRCLPAHRREPALVTFDAMDAIAKHLSAFPSRKNLIWVSASFPFALGFTPEAQRDQSKEHRIFNSGCARLGVDGDGDSVVEEQHPKRYVHSTYRHCAT